MRRQRRTSGSSMRLALLLLALAARAFGQAQDPVPLPAYIGAGLAYNQIGTPSTTAFIGAFYPVSSAKGVYLSTVADIVPVLQKDTSTGRQFYAFSILLRQGAHKQVFSSGRF